MSHRRPRGAVVTAAMSLSVLLAGCAGIPPEPFVVADAQRRAAAMRTSATDLAGAFAQFTADASSGVSVAWAPVGRPDLVQSLGTTTDDDAWSAIKVPIALAAAVDGSGSAATEKTWTTQALTVSDNDAAAKLWRSLGSAQEASTAVEAILRRAGDTRTEVAEGNQGERRGFGRTSWAVDDAARFAAALPCEPGASGVLEPMAHVAVDQQWGLGVLDQPVRFKGGWGPSASGYLVRQIGVVQQADGRQVAVAFVVQPQDKAHATATMVASSLARWTMARLKPGDGGSCPAPTTPDA